MQSAEVPDMMPTMVRAMQLVGNEVIETDGDGDECQAVRLPVADSSKTTGIN
jgi:hypothetical protein